MPSIRDLTLVTVENFHQIVPDFLNRKKILITSYEDMMEAIAQMVQEKHLFNMDRDLLRSMMEDLTFMCCPGDDINKERVMLQLAPSDDEDEESDVEDMPPQVKMGNLVASDIED
jgi:hypothetical protein